MAVQPTQSSDTRAPAPARAVHLVSLANITIEDSRVWPRQELDTDRVKLFAELYANEPDTVPPIEVCAIQYKGQDKPRLVLVDGMHRYHARKRLHAANISAVLREDITTLEDAYIAACAHSAASSKPLSSREKRKAVRHILKTRPKLSDREIARVVGCSHMTVFRERNPIRRALGTVGDNLTDGSGHGQRSEPRRIEERVADMFTRPNAQEPDTAVLTSWARRTPGGRQALYRWLVALAAAYDASASVPSHSANPGSNGTGAARP